MTLKEIIMNGQLRRTTRSVELTGEAITAMRAMVSFTQLLTATTAIRASPLATARRVSHFTCSAVMLVAIQPDELTVGVYRNNRIGELFT